MDNVSRACKVMGFSRATFYRYQVPIAAGDIDALIDANRKKPNLCNRVDDATETGVAAFALEQPAFTQVRVSNDLRKHGIFISPSSVRSVWPILNESYQVAFRSKIYWSIEKLQADLDAWLVYYNDERAHQGKMCFGRPPMQMLLDGNEVWRDKITTLNT